MPRDFPCATGVAIKDGKKGCAACCYNTPWSPGKACPALDVETHLCRLYDVNGVDLRPPICSVRGLWERHVHPRNLSTWNQFIDHNLDCCKLLIEDRFENGGFTKLEALEHLVAIGR